MGAQGVPRTAHEQFMKGKVVPASQMQPGDFIFWDNSQSALPPGRASHVGVYLGNGMFTDAGSGGVRVRKLAGYRPTKRSNMIGVRRF